MAKDEKVKEEKVKKEKTKPVWEDKFNALIQKVLIIDNKDWKLTLEENKTKGTLQVNLREWAHTTPTNEYEGPTKNGFIFKIKTIEDLNNLEQMFSKFFTEAKDML